MSYTKPPSFDVTALRVPIDPPSVEVAAAAAERLVDHSVVMPPGAAAATLGDLAVWLAATQNQVLPRQLINVRLVIFAGDHGVTGGGESESLSEPTGEKVRAALAELRGVNSLAAAHGVTVRVLDLAVDDDFDDLAEESRAALQAYKVRRRSGAIDVEDALSQCEVHTALAAGAAVAHEEIAAGAQLLISGELGGENLTSAAASVAATLGLPASSVVGRGGGIDDSALQRTTAVIASALSRAGDRVGDPMTALAALGSADLAASTGYLLTAARCGIPALIGGLPATASALIADAIAAGAAAWFTAGHRSANDPAQALALTQLGLTPLINRTLPFGEGSGAVAAVPLLRSAAAMLIQTALPSDLTLD
ncbi:nicotinate-nucleotide--dimethylbenzimidazole phosphoribosyltransferase [Candidatus Mycolicibacterium alkanivorans]|uniref:Nicotinate-nucleotide--dimethylbenzimidazole phosphoribosyltransferase n=1 Tax=Candidatus Mycolicibacterium alkanivorans TaxID=2954114 RepID=A0ABS9YXA8_9MYCO|nr:nicotinate-nucleotide--dimethylbenzimidazole phosphoribosyltransferase [Candidatus Mycolicibacterium alkanivorans]MCI4675841.1 nicotinate-nucleotide--dimethylbenzimidazole phosphoribosyltransferase [Candidatus Mycolicibacterium alkanivorans]